MSISAKETIALEQEELDILDAIRKAAPRHRIKSKLAQAYGVWTICFRRYCLEEGMPWLWMSSVSAFMDFLDAHPNVSSGERDRALDGIMFYISDVHKCQKEQADDDDGSAVPRSTQSLFARMLLRCDVQLTEVLHLRRDDIRLEESTLRVSGLPQHDSRTISLPWTLEKGLKHYVQRVEERTTSTNPLLFGHRGGLGEDAGEESASTPTDEDIERSTEVATRVMKTFGSRSPGDTDGEE